MVYKENPTKIDDLGVLPFQETSTYIYIYMYMSRGNYLIQNAIDGVFLPRFSVPSCFLGSDLVL